MKMKEIGLLGGIPSGILLSLCNVGSGSLVPPLDLPMVGCWQWETWATVDWR